SFTDTYLSDLSAQAAGDTRVLLPGYVYGDALAELYANAAAFVLPSYLEGLPLTLLEAISHATPVIASDIGPHVEVVGDDGAGHRLFHAGDEDELLSALRRSMSDPA